MAGVADGLGHAVDGPVGQGPVVEVRPADVLLVERVPCLADEVELLCGRAARALAPVSPRPSGATRPTPMPTANVATRTNKSEHRAQDPRPAPAARRCRRGRGGDRLSGAAGGGAGRQLWVVGSGGVWAGSVGGSMAHVVATTTGRMRERHRGGRPARQSMRRTLAWGVGTIKVRPCRRGDWHPPRPRDRLRAPIPSEPVGDTSVVTEPPCPPPDPAVGLGPLRPAPAGLPDPTRAAGTSPRPAIRSRAPGRRPARPGRARPAGPARRRRRPAQRDLPRLALPGRSSPTSSSSSRRTGWPTTATAPGSSSRTGRTARRSRSRTPAGSIRGSSARPSASAAACRERLADVQPPRPRPGRAEPDAPCPGGPDPLIVARDIPDRPSAARRSHERRTHMTVTGYATTTSSSTPTGPRRTSTTRTSASSRSTSTRPPTSRATSPAPSAGTGRASSPTASAATSPAARTSASCSASRASARTRRSSCTATTTTGSRRGRTGSSSCSATATSGSSTAGASTGSTTACR